jgi:hypothetical protein
MNALAFDTLAYARRLEVAGFSRQQAETLAEEQARLIDDRLATKTDIASVKADIEALKLATNAGIETLKLATNADIGALKLATNASIREAELRLEGKVEAVKADILKWMVGSIGIQTVVIVGAVTALVRLVVR